MSTAIPTSAVLVPWSEFIIGRHGCRGNLCPDGLVALNAAQTAERLNLSYKDIWDKTPANIKAIVTSNYECDGMENVSNAVTNINDAKDYLSKDRSKRSAPVVAKIKELLEVIGDETQKLFTGLVPVPYYLNGYNMKWLTEAQYNADPRLTPKKRTKKPAAKK